MKTMATQIQHLQQDATALKAENTDLRQQLLANRSSLQVGDHGFTQEWDKAMLLTPYGSSDCLLAFCTASSVRLLCSGGNP